MATFSPKDKSYGGAPGHRSLLSGALGLLLLGCAGAGNVRSLGDVPCPPTPSSKVTASDDSQAREQLALGRKSLDALHR